MDHTNEIKPFSSMTKPWSRFWARYFDYFSHATVIVVIWALIDPDSLEGINNNLLEFILMVSWILIDGMYMYIFGTTPGKKIMKIKVINPDGSRIPKSISFKRSLLIWLRGMGLGIGIIQLIVSIIGYSRLKKNGKTSWDKDLDLIVVQDRIGLFRESICPIVIILIICLIIYELM